MRGSTCGAIYVDGWSYDPRVLVQRGEAESVDEVLAEGGFVRDGPFSYKKRNELVIAVCACGVARPELPANVVCMVRKVKRSKSAAAM